LLKLKCIQWEDTKVRFIDQTKLPESLEYIVTEDYRVIAEAICSLRIRGAPAIGIAGAFGAALGVQKKEFDSHESFYKNLEKVLSDLRKTRRTARILFWALYRMHKHAESISYKSVQEIRESLKSEALAIAREDEEISAKIGENGAELLDKNCTVLTHCNTGFLVTAGRGTALGVIYTAVEQGKNVHVYVDETRPLLQGARLTAWELSKAGIKATLICDNMAAWVMKNGRIDCVLVGADRIALNGDVANKIGTYNVAILAEKHGIPFYVAAPYTSFDFSLSCGEEITIEERSPDEVRAGFGKKTAPESIPVYNPAFDVTPNALITAIITEVGVFKSPYGVWDKLKKS